MSYRETFIKRIIELSESNYFTQASMEWEWIEMFDDNNFCLCGHWIVENCVIKNMENGNITTVGNCCIKKFMTELPSDQYFKILNRLKSNNETTIKDINFLKILYHNKIINEWEFGFYMNIKDKTNKKLSEKQKIKKIQIHEKILKKIVKTGKRLKIRNDRK